MFSFYKTHNNDLYNKLVELSRNIFFYRDLKLKDNFETRIILIFLHFSIILNLTKSKNKKLSQEVFDNIFLNVEYHLRELGYGDVSVNSKMKLLNKIFYDILLKILKKKEDKLTVNNKIITVYLNSQDLKKTENINKLTDYLQCFYDFCFDKDHNIVLKGLINFKYFKNGSSKT